MRLLQLQQQSNKLFLLRNYDLRNRLSEKTLQSLLLFCQEYNDKNKIVVNDRLIEIFDGDKHSQNEEGKVNLNESRKEKKRTASEVSEFVESATKYYRLNDCSQQTILQEPILLDFNKKEEVEQINPE